MPESLTQISSQNNSIQNPQQNKNNENKGFEVEKQPQLNQQTKNQKKQEDNDYSCQFKLTIKEKFQQKLKHDQTDNFFIIIVNEIFEERIRRNFLEQGQNFQPVFETTQIVQEKQDELEQKKIQPTLMQKLKSEDQQIKKKIQQLRKKRPNKKQLKFQLDPNRDKGFLLAKRMNQIKQDRQKKYLQSKKLYQQQRKQIIENQSTTINYVENFSIHLAKKRHLGLRGQLEGRLPKIIQNTSFSQNDKFNKSKNKFLDFLTSSKETEQSQSMEFSESISDSRYNSLTLTSRGRYDASKNKKRDLQREIEILRKSQKITEKYQIRKIAYQIIEDLILNSVRLVETKKEFFFKSPPKPVHQMMKNYKDKNGKIVWIPGSKPQKFRINIHLKNKVSKFQEKYNIQNQEQQSLQLKQIQQKQNLKNQSRLSQISHSFDICLKNGQDLKRQISNEDSQQQFQNKNQEIQGQSEKHGITQQQQNEESPELRKNSQSKEKQYEDASQIQIKQDE